MLLTWVTIKPGVGLHVRWIWHIVCKQGTAQAAVAPDDLVEAEGYERQAQVVQANVGGLRDTATLSLTNIAQGTVGGPQHVRPL